ncbi:MAG: aldo/keto reductase [Firmicutes bacterium]|nr:aldo/keto reductase [Bacillota bacterium]
MQYRILGKTGLKVSLLGMGCMRLPFIGNDGNNGVDVPAAIELIQYAANNGINYFDTAFGYHGGESESYLGQALEHMRKDVIYVTKQPFWEMHDDATIRRNLENTLKKLRTDYIDVYLLHRIMPASWGAIQQREVFRHLDNFKREGLVRHVGFSYHGDYETFKDVVAKYPWEMAKVQHNMLDIKREVTPAGIQLAGELGLGIAIMEPLRGGGLAHAPRVVREVYDNAHIQRAPAEWAFRYLANIPEISVITSGMSNLQQLKQNIALFSQPDMVAGALTGEESQVITCARKAYESIVTIPCTTCNYCIPCPAGVQIPNIFGLYNDAHRFEHFDQPRRAYWFAKNARGDATQCTECGLCLEKCPQKINIVEQLKVAHAVLDGWKE